MRQSLPFVLAAALALIPASGAASVVTPDDLVKLSAAGLGDDILIALIDSDGAVFKLTADEILSLRDRGLSQKVILAMVQTARRPSSATSAPPRDVPDRSPARALDGGGTPAAETPAVEPPAPVIVHVTQQVEQHVEQPREPSPRTVYVSTPVAVPVYVIPPRPERRPEPVYWGFGGQRRPGTWKDR